MTPHMKALEAACLAHVNDNNFETEMRHYLSSLLSNKEVIKEVTAAIVKVFIPDGVYNIGEGFKFENAAKAAIASIKAISSTNGQEPDRRGEKL